MTWVIKGGGFGHGVGLGAYGAYGFGRHGSSYRQSLGHYFRGIEVTGYVGGDSPRIDYARLIGTGGRSTIRGETLAATLGLYDRWAYFRKVK